VLGACGMETWHIAAPMNGGKWYDVLSE
jgi:hypothetical protein